MTDTVDVGATANLSRCDQEPIRIPEAIQPHGLLLLVDPGTRTIQREAGPMATVTGTASWLDRPVDDLLGDDLARRLTAFTEGSGEGFAGRWRAADGLDYDVVAHATDAGLVVEIEQGSQEAQTGVDLIVRLDSAAAALARATSVREVCQRAAEAFRALIGFERVMIYRFLEDGAGQVVAESRADGVDSFLNHYFPSTDIPQQARALYLLNPVRVIPDVAYEPQPVHPPADRPLDMSHCGLRSVSPVHLAYLANMGVRASASMSIIIDGELWGLVACHGTRPRLLPYELRVASTTLARSLARQIKDRTEAELYRDRVRLRQVESELLGRLSTDRLLDRALGERARELSELVDSDGVAIVSENDVRCLGVTPPEAAIQWLADRVRDQPSLRPLATHALSRRFPEAARWAAEASGLLGVYLPGDHPITLLWFRAEIIETVRWAGNPSTAVKHGPAGALTPRASFEAWSETVRGRSRRWAAAEIESVTRLRDALSDVAAVSQLRRLNRTLQVSLSDRDLRIEQQEFLIREVNHRVQNSLTLVSSFLGLQAREASPETRAELLEARRRVRAVSLVHSRLYRSEATASVDLERYFDELITDLGASMGVAWSAMIETELAPVQVETSRAVTVGLILTELIINAQKYAYDGDPGPIRIRLDEDGNQFRLSVADAGKGGHEAGKGFGSMMIGHLVNQLGGQLDYRDARPGLLAALKAPVAAGG